MSYELGASVIPPVSVGALIAIMLWFRKERLDKEQDLKASLELSMAGKTELLKQHLEAQDNRMREILGAVALSAKLERELSDRLSRIEGRLERRG